MQAVIQDVKDRMTKALASLDKDLAKLRTGRASASLVEDLKVEYYGNATALSQMASVATPDARTITIQPWDRNAFADIEKAIQKSDLGLNPVNDGKLIRVSLPPLTEERRKDLVKMAKKHAEETKVALRNIRRDANDALKKKKGEASEDELHKIQDQVQKLTDDHVAKADQILHKKEKEIMEI